MVSTRKQGRGFSIDNYYATPLESDYLYKFFVEIPPTNGASEGYQSSWKRVRKE